MINLKGFLVLLLVVSGQSKDCTLTAETFLKHTQLCEKIRENIGDDGFEFESSWIDWFKSLFSKEQDPPVVDSYISTVCWTYNLSIDSFKIDIKACVSIDGSVILELLSLSGRTDSTCTENQIKKNLQGTDISNLCTGDSPNGQFTSTTPAPTKPSTCTCPYNTSPSNTRMTDLTTLLSTVTPNRSDPASAFTSGPSTSAPGVSSDSSSLTSAIPTSSPSASTPKPSLATSQSTTVSTSSSSITSDEYPPITERQHDAPDVGQGHSEATTAIIAVTSFIVGVLVGILCLLALYYKRTGKLCFTSTKKPTEGLSSDRVTKKVLAKHLRSVRHDSPASNNVVHYESEPNTKGVDDDTEGMYTYIDQSDAGKDQQPSGDKGRLAPLVPKQPGTKMKTQQEYTDITFSNPAAVTPPDEHVYNHLQLERQVDQTEQPRKAINGVANGDQSYGAVKGLRVPETTNSDVFDCGRDSSVSGHDYFVLQNENFRTSQQPEVLKEPEVKVSDGESATRSDEMSSTGDAENAYFVLKKE